MPPKPSTGSRGTPGQHARTSIHARTTWATHGTHDQHQPPRPANNQSSNTPRDNSASQRAPSETTTPKPGEPYASVSTAPLRCSARGVGGVGALSVATTRARNATQSGATSTSARTSLADTPCLRRQFLTAVPHALSATTYAANTPPGSSHTTPGDHCSNTNRASLAGITSPGTDPANHSPKATTVTHQTCNDRHLDHGPKAHD